MSLHDIFRAGFVRRWHSNPDLAHTDDRIDGHSARVARIIAAWHPSPPPELLVAALTHDDGEEAVGDMKATFKGAFPEIAAALAVIEAAHVRRIWLGSAVAPVLDADLSPRDHLWLKFADRLDGLMWAAHHRADLSADGWPESITWLKQQAVALGRMAALDNLLHQMRIAA
jgi:hypothetical protein